MNKELNHWKTITYWDSGEIRDYYWYAGITGRVVQSVWCPGNKNIPAYAVDLGRHSSEPMYENEKPFSETCSVLGSRCYYDGTSLGASEFARENGVTYRDEPDDIKIFNALDVEWQRWFEGNKKSPFAELNEVMANKEAPE